MNTELFIRFPQQLVMAKIEPAPEPSPKDALINYGAEHLIDIGVVLIAFMVVIIIGMISKQLETAILFALGLSAFLIIILWT